MTSITSHTVTPFSLKDAPALIERLLPVQKLSAEAYKEQMAGSGKTLTALGSYWKGRKPLILTKACILGCLLPATDDPARDLEIFEKLMAMDDESFVARWPRRFKPKDILATLSIAQPADYFTFHPSSFIPHPSPWDWSKPEYKDVKVAWRDDMLRVGAPSAGSPDAPAGSATVNEWTRPSVPRKSWTRSTITSGMRSTPTSARVPIRFRSWSSNWASCGLATVPSVADTFCGSGQIPFEAARLGCDVYASDLNPVACMLTWGASISSGGPRRAASELATDQQELVRVSRRRSTGSASRRTGKAGGPRYFCTAWKHAVRRPAGLVPLLPTRVVSKSRKCRRRTRAGCTGTSGTTFRSAPESAQQK